MAEFGPELRAGDRWPIDALRAEFEHGPDAEYLSKVPTASAVISVLLSRLEAVVALHEQRHRTVEGAVLRWCRECGVDWPCPTVAAAESAPTVFLRPQPNAASEGASDG